MTFSHVGEPGHSMIMCEHITKSSIRGEGERVEVGTLILLISPIKDQMSPKFVSHYRPPQCPQSCHVSSFYGGVGTRV